MKFPLELLEVWRCGLGLSRISQGSRQPCDVDSLSENESENDTAGAVVVVTAVAVAPAVVATRVAVDCSVMVSFRNVGRTGPWRHKSATTPLVMAHCRCCCDVCWWGPWGSRRQAVGLGHMGHLGRWCRGRWCLRATKTV